MKEYVALEDIGGYNKGSIVPSDKAIVWISMYKNPPVKIIITEETEVFESNKKEEEVKEFFSNITFSEELLSIKGVGKKTVIDIIKIYREKKELLTAITAEEHIPLQDGIVKKLLKKYGGKK